MGLDCADTVVEHRRCTEALEQPIVLPEQPGFVSGGPPKFTSLLRTRVWHFALLQGVPYLL